MNYQKESMLAVPQGYKLMGYILTAERKLAENLFHAGQQLMTWAAGNARVA
ncbi:hypothetical protein ACKUV4_015455 [Acinetobacter baumannii]